MGWSKIENNVSGQTDALVSDSATSMAVSLYAGSRAYPAGIDADTPMYLTISDPENPLTNEIVKVTSVSGSDVVVMVRGQRGTIAQQWPSGSLVELNLLAEDVNAMRDAIDTLAAIVDGLVGT